MGNAVFLQVSGKLDGRKLRSVVGGEFFWISIAAENPLQKRDDVCNGRCASGGYFWPL